MIAQIMYNLYMKKYEYQCISIWGNGERTKRILDEYGLDGWELVAVWTFWHYLKREVLTSEK